LTFDEGAAVATVVVADDWGDAPAWRDVVEGSATSSATALEDPTSPVRTPTATIQRRLGFRPFEGSRGRSFKIRGSFFAHDRIADGL